MGKKVPADRNHLAFQPKKGDCRKHALNVSKNNILNKKIFKKNYLHWLGSVAILLQVVDPGTESVPCPMFHIHGTLCPTYLEDVTLSCEAAIDLRSQARLT